MRSYTWFSHVLPQRKGCLLLADWILEAEWHSQNPRNGSQAETWFPSFTDLCFLLLLSQRGGQGSLCLWTHSAPGDSQSTSWRNVYNPGTISFTNSFVNIWSLTFWQKPVQLQFLSNLRWEGRERQGGLCRPYNPYSSWNSLRQCTHTERNIGDRAVLDGITEAASLQTTDLCLSQSQAYTAWILHLYFSDKIKTKAKKRPHRCSESWGGLKDSRISHDKYEK